MMNIFDVLCVFFCRISNCNLYLSSARFFLFFASHLYIRFRSQTRGTNDS